MFICKTAGRLAAMSRVPLRLAGSVELSLKKTQLVDAGRAKVVQESARTSPGSVNLVLRSVCSNPLEGVVADRTSENRGFDAACAQLLCEGGGLLAGIITFSLVHDDVGGRNGSTLDFCC